MATRIGIVGDGQLGMLLCEAAGGLGITTAILTSNADSAAAQRTDTAVVGGMEDPAAIAELVKRSDIITYEREDVSRIALEILRNAEAAGEVRCYPRLATIEIIQDKALQKTWLAESDLPTLPFLLSHAVSGAGEAAAVLGYPLVQKSLRGGFDGRGVQIIHGHDDLNAAWPGETLYEAYAGHFTEIAVMVIRKADGEMRTFPPVDMTFDTGHSVLDWVFAPSAFDESVLAKAEQVATRAIEALDGIGVFGVELFRLENGEILINEISPRVHNAGHFTLDATESSQFEQHLRAITGMPLAGTALRRPAAMRNLLCNDSLKAAAEGRDAGCDRSGDTAIYWYGKSPSRAMRKLGHITATGDSPIAAADKVAAAYKHLTGGQQGAIA
ncbi:5-(carboxyamino)imidazole ribonucleotide synthase [Chromatocurvus halotolerans]|uniref:N5-carboxyaminoimidazole ribonucleotide synthase n=1 Tax=Chromatocurvus halotolerans TaxID=1132028 RepID=A0A4R2L6N9_9GAMM|nr:5-(carboxyamino)imidazole ribonucleotide synthase [Chromatocurvus halotolerans]TCO78328.1 5-(carboxyamino)imidazole ribonucleotide synthase [Chromatocurvus halotolerans]